ncbi:hypothetical protein LOH54_01850 [Sulfurimonas sp. HSL-3221]|uniref:hypothetical protein n=1 Tax=Sulfurimonadaceae TaxID=2771471 RepID=UPI001E3C3616|nr:hypothetical protein [Sulfurimonas sp. HSL-3221]UFS62886.1 hypothetical protein LOH54_01850 [Sulfurimonas sp. HSL-3221]
MNLVSKMLTAAVSAAAIVAMTACGGGGGSSTPAGVFLKTVVDSVTSGNRYPLNNDDAYQKYQNLYLASEIEGSGNIEKISLYYFYDEPAAISCPQMTIRLGHSGESNLTATYADNVENGYGSLQTVFDNRTLTIPAGNAGEAFDITLDEPFAYNGKDNLVIEFERSAACSANLYAQRGDRPEPRRAYNFGAVSPTATGLDGTLLKATFAFSGGDNTQYYGTGLDHAYPLTTGANLHLQNMYMAADINGSGPITGYALRLNKLSVEGNYTMTVKMGHASSNVLSATFADNADKFVTVAQDVTVHVPAGIPAGGWVWIPLDGSFNYNGTDNLVVDFTTSIGQGGLNYAEAVDMGGSQRVYGINTATGTVDGYVNNAKFRFNGATTNVLMSTSNSGQAFPFWATVGSMQQLYSAYQLGSAGTINRIECRANTDNPADSGFDYDVTMAHTTSMDLSSVFADNLMTDKTLVFSGMINTPAVKAGDWVGITLKKPFHYDGVSNLVLEIRGTGGSGDSVDCRRGAAPNQQLLWGNYDEAATTGSTEANLIDTRFYFK